MLIYLLPGGLEGKASACNAGDPGLIPESGSPPGEGNGNPFQGSCLGNPVDKEPDGLQSMGSQKSQIGLSAKSGKEYVKAVYCHPAYLTHKQST